MECTHFHAPRFSGLCPMCLQAEIVSLRAERDLALRQRDHHIGILDKFEREAGIAARQDAEALDRYRYAVAFAAADSWDGGPDMRQRLEWARANDPGGNLTNDRIAEIGQTFPVHMRAVPRQDAEKIEILEAELRVTKELASQSLHQDAEEKARLTNEKWLAEIAGWALCEQSRGGGPGKCSLSSCACGGEGIAVARAIRAALACTPAGVPNGTQQTEEIARLQAFVIWLENHLRDAVNVCYGGTTHKEIDARVSAALACRPQDEVHTPSHGPFPGAPFSPPKGDK
jgi:hypothetical protein